MSQTESPTFTVPLEPEDIARQIFEEHYIRLSGTLSSMDEMYIKTDRLYRYNRRRIEEAGYVIRWVRPDDEDEMTICIEKKGLWG